MSRVPSGEMLAWPEGLLGVSPFALGGILLTLIWVHVSGQTEVSKSWRYSLGVAIRILVLYLASWGIAIYGMEFTVGVVCILVTLSLVVMNMMTLSPRTGEFSKALDADLGAVVFAVVMALLIPLHMLRQFILRVPDQDLLAEEPVLPRPVKQLDPAWLDARAMVDSSLKPSGIIDVNGQKLEACSYDGGFLPSGTEVVICGERRGVALVKRVAEHEQPHAKVV